MGARVWQVVDGCDSAAEAARGGDCRGLGCRIRTETGPWTEKRVAGASKCSQHVGEGAVSIHLRVVFRDAGGILSAPADAFIGLC